MRQNTPQLSIASFCFILLTLIFMGFRQNIDNTPSGSVGDVKYSLLAPDIFLPNNPGWELLAGQDIDIASELRRYGFSKLPDARGLFIRSMIFNRNDNLGDPFKIENGRERTIMDYQSDTLKLHHHGYQLAKGETNAEMARARTEIRGYTDQSTTDFGGLETRPGNIALYLYVKIK